MANISEAIVDMEAKGCYKELRNFARATEYTEYPFIVAKWADAPADNKLNSGTIEGSSSGRWNYAGNLEGYIGYDELKGKWIEDTARKEWEALKAKLLDGAEIKVHVKDFEPGCELLLDEYFTIDKDGLHDGDCTSYELTPDNLIELGFYDDIDEASEALGINGIEED